MRCFVVAQAVPDFRSECLYVLPALRELDGTAVTTMEKVAAQSIIA